MDARLQAPEVRLESLNLMPMHMTQHVAAGQAAPDFELTDVQGRTVRLSDYRHKKHVVLVFTRGFI